MATERRWDGTPPSERAHERAYSFPGELPNVTGARLAAEEFLRGLAREAPPSAPEYWDDILLVVTELAANAVQFAPGPFGLRMRRTFDGVHVTMHDTSTVVPEPRPFRPSSGGGGIGWHLVHTLCDQVSVVVVEDGKDIHAFLPW
ncbi:ATP-binding protein [Streptomyces griseoluteus]|uniref:ATP-binding protein n=1 Tax=Streptomyces griseoluteus TaxID=29306 RepID=A0A4Z1D146_STRGP|nr:ATP-binding protein [Streptomyces griseoluteus]TGN75146.1 ATP-binding protein [Streptomyces griseoluteus]GHF35192.1 ATP-binding protein [Streptomyces griseoluteus]